MTPASFRSFSSSLHPCCRTPPLALPFSPLSAALLSLAPLDPRVRAVAEYIVDASARRAELSRLGVDVGACPSLRLAPAQVAKAHDVLGQISQIVSGEATTTGDTVDVLGVALNVVVRSRSTPHSLPGRPSADYDVR